MLLLTSTNWILSSFLKEVISSLTIVMKVQYPDPKCQRFSKLTPNSSHPSKWEFFFFFPDSPSQLLIYIIPKGYSRKYEALYVGTYSSQQAISLFFHQNEVHSALFHCCGGPFFDSIFLSEFLLPGIKKLNKSFVDRKDHHRRFVGSWRFYYNSGCHQFRSIKK